MAVGPKKVDLNQPISHSHLNAPAYQSLLQDLQGNILKSHGRDHAVHMLIRFKQSTPEDRATAKSCIREFAATYVTSAKQQYEDSGKYRKAKKAGQLAEPGNFKA